MFLLSVFSESVWHYNRITQRKSNGLWRYSLAIKTIFVKEPNFITLKVTLWSLPIFFLQCVTMAGVCAFGEFGRPWGMGTIQVPLPVFNWKWDEKLQDWYRWLLALHTGPRIYWCTVCSAICSDMYKSARTRWKGIYWKFILFKILFTWIRTV